MPRTRAAGPSALVLAALLAACGREPARESGPVLTAEVRRTPTPVRAHGKAHLVYELHVTNRTRGRLHLDRLDVVDAAGGHRTLLSWDGGALAENVKWVGERGQKPRNFDPGIDATIFCWVALDTAEVPTEIEHRVTVSGKRLERPVTVDLARVSLRPSTGLVLGPPLRGGNWWAAIGPANHSQHRRAQVRVEGDPKAPYAQRFAIDWARVEAGAYFRGKGTSNGDYFGYGADVIAVADAVVAAAHDSVPDNEPGEGSRAVEMTKATFMGNYVVQSLGEGRYALYAHLRPGSLRVRAGEQVRRGQVIGQLGNSGNSDAPHLHFHVAAAPSVGRVVIGQGEGVPYVLEGFEIVDHLARAPGDMQPPLPVLLGARRMELPMEEDVVRFRLVGQ